MFESFRIGSLEIQTYGLMMLLAFIAGCVVVSVRFKKFKLKADAFYFVAAAMIGGVIGSKILYWIVEWRNFGTAFAAMFSGWDNVKVFFRDFVMAGLVYYGGYIGGFLGAMLYIRHSSGVFSEYVNPVIPALPLGQAIGRVGCFLGGCCYGSQTDCAIGVHFPNVAGTVWPTQLFECGLNLILFGVLLLICTPGRKRPLGLAWYSILYAVIRFAVECFRGDPRGHVGALSTSQFISIIIFVIGILTLIFEKQFYGFMDRLTAHASPNGGAAVSGGGPDAAGEDPQEDRPDEEKKD